MYRLFCFFKLFLMVGKGLKQQYVISSKPSPGRTSPILFISPFSLSILQLRCQHLAHTQLSPAHTRQTPMPRLPETRPIPRPRALSQQTRVTPRRHNRGFPLPRRKVLPCQQKRGRDPSLDRRTKSRNHCAVIVPSFERAVPV